MLAEEGVAAQETVGLPTVIVTVSVTDAGSAPGAAVQVMVYVWVVFESAQVGTPLTLLAALAVAKVALVQEETFVPTHFKVGLAA